MAQKTTTPRRIVFVHPDLGIGGAERLVIDAAVGLQSLGHTVTILTSYRNKAHCFEEARDGTEIGLNKGTLDVRVRGDALFPPSIGGRLSILFSILRQLALVTNTGVFSNELRTLAPDVIIVDQLSACIPYFRTLYPHARILFYGHYPDRLLVQEETGARKYVKKAYRIPFDLLEGWSTGCSDSIVVNSKFTRSVFKKTFPSMRNRELKVVYPCVDTTPRNPAADLPPLWPDDKKLLLSINRFEMKKNLDLAVKAYAGLSKDERSRARLVLSGGYDPRNAENAYTHKHLQTLADSLDLTHTTLQKQSSNSNATTDDLANISQHNTVDVLFLLSIPNELKTRLLDSASLLLYTPENEHFGIVPLEAMLAGVPVLATNTGGPLETIYDGRTGFLRPPDKITAWTDVMRKPLIPSSVATLKTMGDRGCERVRAEFSHTQLAVVLDREVQRLATSDLSTRTSLLPPWFIAALVAAIVAILTAILLTLL